ncbi:sensor histidine kinase [Calidifontibacter terrae]
MLTLLLLLALTVTGVAASLLLQRYLLQRQDAELRAATSPLVSAALAARPDGDTQLVPAYVPTGTYVVRLRGADGNHTDTFRPPGASVPNWPELGESSGTAGPFTVDSQTGDDHWRVMVGTHTDAAHGTFRYAVAVSLNSVDATVSRVVAIVTATGVIVTLFGGFAGWYGVRRAFRPLTEIEDTAATIAGGDLTRRVPEADSRDEVASLSRSLNLMLARIEESFTLRERSEEKMRQFVADASHELRTPLATVRGYAELYRQGAVSSPTDVAAAVLRIENEATRMGGMVESLLLLNRLDEPHGGHQLTGDERDEVDLTVIAADAVQDARVRDRDREIRMLSRSGPVGPTPVIGDDSALRQVIANLIGNALRYSPTESPIEVAVGAEGDYGVTEVRDHGPGIPAALRDRVFERFYRADESRNSATGGSGLGLAIVKAIVDSHDGSVEVRETSGGGATFLVRIPLATRNA